jgi:hypothetical protein
MMYLNTMQATVTPFPSARAIAYIGAKVFACGFGGSLKRNLSKQFGVPVAVRSSHNEFVVGDKQIRTDVVDCGRSPLVEYVGGVEVMPRRGPQSPACLVKLTGRGPEIALQRLRDPRD